MLLVFGDPLLPMAMVLIGKQLTYSFSISKPLVILELLYSVNIFIYFSELFCPINVCLSKLFTIRFTFGIVNYTNTIKYTECIENDAQALQYFVRNHTLNLTKTYKILYYDF